MRFENQVVLVTGAARGIGQAVAAAYAKEGAKLLLLDKDGEALAQSAGKLRQTGAEVSHYIVNLSKPEEIAACFRQFKESWGRLDILINNAGFGIGKSPYDLTVEEWDDVLGTNLRGTFLCSREAALLMRTHGGGSIVNLASTRAFMSEPNTEAYAASKGGVIALTHALAVSFGPDRIRVNAVSPGWIETGDYAKLKPSDHAQHPAGRVGRPDDIARACLYLTHPDNDFITGTNLMIDGGMTRKMIYEE